MIWPSAHFQIWVKIAIFLINFQAIDDLGDRCALAIHVVDAVTGKLISESTSDQCFDQIPDYLPLMVLVLYPSLLLCCE